MMLKHVNLKMILREVEFQYLQTEAPAVSLRAWVASLVINEHEYIKDDLDYYKYDGPSSWISDGTFLVDLFYAFF